MQQRTTRGKMSWLAGMAAEDAVVADYARRGHSVAARRWRGSRGEIDIVARDGDGLIVVEVKQARDFARAAYRAYFVAVTMAIVGSIETLLCIEATDQLDPDKRT